MARLFERLIAWLLLMATYTVGAWTITAGTPLSADVSTGPNDYRFFPGIINFGNGNYLLRMSDVADSAGQALHHRHMISRDGGATWTTPHSVYGVHTSREPLTFVPGSDGQGPAVIAPSVFPRGPSPILGTYQGGSYLCTVQAGLRSVRSDFVQIRNGGLDYTATYGGALISGFSRDIAAAYWFGDIVKLSTNNWVSCLQVQYVGDTPYTGECIQSGDQGKTWTKIGTVATTAIGGEGFSEPCMIKVPATGELMVLSRVGVAGGTTKLARVFSTGANDGTTWGAVDRIPAYGKAASPFQLANGDFLVLTGGMVNTGTDNSIKGLGLWLETDPHGAWSTAPWDLVLHHNAMISDPNQQFYPANPPAGTRGYAGICEVAKLSNGSQLKITYDRSAGADAFDSTPNRIYVVDVTITR